MLNRKVMMSDGLVRDTHRIVAITHRIGVNTIIEILSTILTNNEDIDTHPFIWKHVINPYNTSITESDAYNIISNLDKMAEYRDPIDDVLPILTDEQAEQLTNLYPDWNIDISYSVGVRVKYNGKLYKCIQDHTSQIGWEPNVATSLWSRTGEDPTNPDAIPEWVQPTGASDAYKTGDQVTHNNSTWISLVDSNVWEPGVYGWDELVTEE